ncbi:MAG: ABC transporter ATP-binding protein/permease [Paenibacillus macerans]|uniref:ABC transporter family protein n=1 Tax=Paenibacillus macerans TaxID=44252 RepID=A0A090ZLB4_PAEMA|nr:ABC transporter ATP-binding protein/permease [Paenibacillus macerans]KFN11045.1 ABC transporter family protein [Paenibacillus macerans]MBS5915100.1 ABC transporter ATP-binding protein/permease [Paenibacillus macerans]MCY7560837.1 ABC transporter ATP-binding protein/permease [Paenibacillus macerans]MDU7477063.1 ABC transporter ATP-binding protein/permease [Paenibacillus macerans]MEC0152243.1 ABC transporter ATP-binding protein/permease [Paenibacillus macerans]
MFIDVANLKKSYTTDVVKTEVLKGIGMQLEKGEIGVILGPSGSGKSTLMNILGGIDRGDSGRVIVGGTEISRLNADKLTDYRRENIGFVFQFYNLVPNLTVAENIEVVSNISKFPLNTDEVLAAVRIKDKKHRFPRELSGGEQQRVSIARAIVKNPQLLLCDEPTGALDFDTSRSILQLLQQVNQTYGTTISPLASMVVFVAEVAFLIGMMIIYVVTSMIIEENKSTISLMKDFGYRKKEVNSLVLNSSTVVVAAGYILGILLSFAAMGDWMKAIENSAPFAMPVIIDPLYIGVGFVIVMFSNELSKLLCRKKVHAVSMSEALKAGTE